MAASLQSGGTSPWPEMTSLVERAVAQIVLMQFDPQRPLGCRYQGRCTACWREASFCRASCQFEDQWRKAHQVAGYAIECGLTTE